MNDVDKVANNAKDQAMEVSGYLRDKVSEFGKDTLDKALDTQEYFLQLVKNNPYKSLGLAFLSGYLISFCRNKFNGS